MKWMSIPVSVIFGIALMVVLGFILELIIPVNLALEDGFVVMLGILVFSYFATGLVAGAWANWRGATYGTFATILVWVFNLFYSLFAFGPIGYPGPTSPLVGVWMWSILIFGFFAVGVGALGGFVGERVRE